MTWTDERVEILKAKWAQGYSASQIAGELGGITRNAVIGKVARLGLVGRRTVKYSLRGNGTIVTARTPKPNTEHIAPPLAPIPVPEISVVHKVTFKDLNNRLCHFPLWLDEESQEEKFYCGATSCDLLGGRPYCSAHARIIYTAPLPRKERPYWSGESRRRAAG